jgi:hypothetical protein
MGVCALYRVRLKVCALCRLANRSLEQAAQRPKVLMIHGGYLARLPGSKHAVAAFRACVKTRP